ncbi:LysR family transcriptional regulator [Oryzobacter terrae]|uniref:LysR family transcriptional regulator n=1 Tax=Oryzobacter terrae TaxID=1620385 RepID=UPI00366B5E54
MRLEHVKAFTVLAEELNFRRAARRLFLSQSTLTAQIHGLERDLGVELFERGRDGTRLTPDGLALLPLARRALSSLAALETGARHGAAATVVQVGVAPDGIGPGTWSAFRGFEAAVPDVEVSIRPVGFSTMLSVVDDGVVDAVLLHGPVDPAAGRVVVTVGEVRAGVMLPRSHPLAAGGALHLDDVVPLLRAAPPDGAGPAFAHFWLARDHPAAPAPRDLHLEEDSPSMARTAALIGLVGLWPSDVTVPEDSGAVFRPLVEDRWAPLQVLHRPTLALAKELVAAAASAVLSTSRAGVTRPVVGQR